MSSQSGPSPIKQPNTENQQASSHADRKTLGKGLTLLLGISLVSFLSLGLLMFATGDGLSQAYSDDELAVLENSTVHIAPISLQSSFQRKRSVYGTVESALFADLGFELAGVLKHVLVEEGEQVEKGQVLAQLDITRLEARRVELKASLQRANADAKLAELSLKRIADLVSRELEPKQRLDESEAVLDAALAVVNEVEARLDSLAVEIAKSSLIAPFDGQALRQIVDEGTVLSSGQAVFTLLSDSALEARFGLPERVAFGLSPGDSYMLELGESTIPATVKSVARQRNLSTRTIDTLFEIDKSDLSFEQLASMVSGDLVKISVYIEQEKRGTWVPVSALASGVRGLWTLLVYDDDSERLLTRTVSLEHLDGDRAFVSGTIAPGDRIVISGTHRFTPNQRVSNIVERDNPALASETGSEPINPLQKYAQRKVDEVL
uniref:efflux RND transporter periplasmic adaptor subunit n=1 Tax=Ningiella ruwaisensis TaxID=2364274 RepID=UPI0010A0B606|nr:efflux RND transporter periplasmic adaptor subunit [Ningiella ruwaisensis]